MRSSSALFSNQCEEAAEHVAADGLRRACGRSAGWRRGAWPYGMRFCCSPSKAACSRRHGLERVETRCWCAATKMPSNFCSSSILSRGRSQSARSLDCLAGSAELAGYCFDQRLVATWRAGAPARPRSRRGRRRRSPPPRSVAADDVAPPGQHHRLGLVVDPLAALFCRQWHDTVRDHRCTNSRTSLSERSRTPRIYKSRRASSSAIVSAS